MTEQMIEIHTRIGTAIQPAGMVFGVFRGGAYIPSAVGDMMPGDLVCGPPTNAGERAKPVKVGHRNGCSPCDGDLHQLYPVQKVRQA